MQEKIVIGGRCTLSQLINGNCTLSNAIQGEVGTFTPVLPEGYTGETTITPSESAQTLETRGLVLPENITIQPIPSNYGRISWNGSTLTVS